MNARAQSRHGRQGHEADQTARQFDIVLSDGFVLTEYAALTDALRIANRVSAQAQFSWTCRSAKGGTVTSLSGASVETQPFAQKSDADYLFVLGNSDQDSPSLSLGHVIDRYTNRNIQVFLLSEAASRYIKERGPKSAHLTTHWENSAVLKERTGLFDADNALASEDGQVVTCAGMGATLDVVLSVIGRHVSSAVLMTVANVFLHERIRDFGTRQPFGGTAGTATGDKVLDRAIEIMQDNIEEPLSVAEITKRLGLSSRSLERRFQSRLGTTPNTYYREMRLARANNLLLNTAMSVREIGLACGFSGGFSVLYKSFFGVTPLQMRRTRQPLQSREKE
ncbi:GlxA family transcriptional regulator [Roseovarius phycicola]|uniref:Helix-turn-helix domain-containing protein n=1 Tax=Roseovarius phycicola TaxID=3080976 RepID=A0ABZ2HJ78_9RHOB